MMFDIENNNNSISFHGVIVVSETVLIIYFQVN